MPNEGGSRSPSADDFCKHFREALERDGFKTEPADGMESTGQSSVRSVERFSNTSESVDMFFGGTELEAELRLNRLEQAKATGYGPNGF